MKKIIVTGATGFIGGALTKKLLLQGEKVYGIDINAERLEEMKQYGNFVPVVADFTMYYKLNELIKDKDFDCFIHTAWTGSFVGADCYNYKAHNQNIDAVCIACEKAKELGTKRFVFCGSSYQYMRSIDSNINPNYYGIVKKAAADYCYAICQKNNIECNIAVLTNTYGIGDRSKKAVNTFIKKMLANKKIDLIEGLRPNDWMYIDDTVEGIIKTAESPCSYKLYYVGHKSITTFKEKLIAMKDILNSRSELIFGTYLDNSFVDYSFLDPTELTQDTDFKCKTDYAESIRKTAEWVKTLDWEV